MTKKNIGKKKQELGHSSEHHIISQSIGGPDISENKYRWAKKKHRAYHQLFYNYIPSIVIVIIEGWSDKNGDLEAMKVGSGNLKAWRRVFGDQKPAQAIQFIKERFLPVEEKFLEGLLK